MRLGTKLGKLLARLGGVPSAGNFEVDAREADPDPSVVPGAVSARQQELIDQVLVNPVIGGHSLRTAVLSVEIAKRLGLTTALGDIFLGGLFHDVGQLFVPPALLVAPRPLTPTERTEIVESHPVLGALVLGGAGLSQAVLDCVLHHHERWDGGGYPYGLAHDRIPVAARIVAVAEVYDVLTHDQAYRAALTREETLDEVCHAAGNQLDPEVAILAYDLLHKGSSSACRATPARPAASYAVRPSRPPLTFGGLRAAHAS